MAPNPEENTTFMWKLNQTGLNAVSNAVARRVKFGMKLEAWIEDAEEEANRAWEDPEWTHREAEIELLPIYCKDGKSHTVPLFPSWFDWIADGEIAEQSGCEREAA